MRRGHILLLSTGLAALAAAGATLLAVNSASGQRRGDLAYCEFRETRNDEFVLRQIRERCLRGDTVVVESPTIAARVCDFAQSMISDGRGNIVCVITSIRDPR